MQLALLGCDEQILAILAALAAENSHAVVAGFDLGRHEPKVLALCPQVRVVDFWQQLLAGDEIEAVLVAADRPDERLAQLKQLMQEGMPAVVSHPLGFSFVDLLEVDLARSETHTLLVPYLPGNMQPAVLELWNWLAAGGDQARLTLEREVADTSREAVLTQFARDVPLIELLLGPCTRLHAFGPEKASANYDGLTVQLTAGKATARWSVTSARETQRGKLAVRLPAGDEATLTIADDSPWCVVMDGQELPAQESPEQSPPFNAAVQLFDSLASPDAAANTADAWSLATRAVELTEAVERSLSRGRTIDVEQEEVTEVGNFKGVMASVGCAVLMGGLVLIVGLLILGSVAKAAGWKQVAEVVGWGPYLIGSIMALFLALQALLLVAVPVEKSTHHAPRDDSEHSQRIKPG